MTIQFASAQNLKSIAGATFFGLGLDFASCHLTQVWWFIVREAVTVLFWGLLAGLQASQTQILGQLLGQHAYLPGCPLQMLFALRPLLHLLGAAV